MLRRRRLLVLSLCLCASLLVFAQKRSITEKDLFQFNWIGDPQVSPDGSRTVFVKVTVNEKKDGYDTSIWSVSTRGDEAPRRITDGSHDSSPRWSPDGKWIVFVRTPESPAGGTSSSGAVRPSGPQLYMLPMNGGESWRITDLPRGAGNPVWSPDGKMIAFINSASPDDLAKQRKGDKGEKDKGEKKDGEKADGEKSSAAEGSGSNAPGTPEHESDIHVITRSVYRMNGGGYLDPKHPPHIWVMTAPQSSEDMAKPKQLTSGPYAEGQIFWSKDGSQVYFTTQRVLDASYELPHTDLYSAPATGGEPTKISSIDLGVNGLSLSPDGKRVAFCASVNEPVYSYTEPDLWVMDLTSGAKPHNLTADYDFDMCAGVGGDQGTPRAAGGEPVIWTPDSNRLIVVTGREGKSNLVEVDASSGKMTEITRGNQAIERYRASADASKLVVLISTPTNIGDLFLVERSGGSPKQLTHINEKLFAQLNLTAPEEFWYTSFDGKRIEAWIQKPPDFDPSKKYPLILDIHGGPHTAYGYVFDHEFQWMAAKGYVVLYPNPRGSTTYGQEFGNIIQYHYPGDDFKDLMAGVDELIARGWVDPQKLGVTGGSGGGVLTNWVIGHTQRFKAAVAQRDIADWADFWYTADFTLFTPSWFRGAPWEQEADFKARSPITYIRDINTPLMLILGEADYRTPPGSGGEQMFRALKYKKIPTVMVRFPNETHELSRSGMPKHRVERLQHIVSWFDIYLQGKEIHTYDVQ